MLYDADIIRLITDLIAPLDIPIILDPVCVSKAGASLLQDDAIEALYDLSRIVTLTTPNLHEAYQLFGYKSGDTDSLKKISPMGPEWEKQKPLSPLSLQNGVSNSITHLAQCPIHVGRA